MPHPLTAPAPKSTDPQHLQALARANQVRLARAALKRSIAGGQCSVAEVIVEAPWESETMTISELLSSQHRWGRTRSRKFLSSLGLNENKKLNTLTDRQRRLAAAALQTRIVAAPQQHSEPEELRIAVAV